jgi:hypothetical protein
MAISEETFLAWTKPPSDSEDAKCENAVKSIKEAIRGDEALAKYQLDIFAQGSYANSTNVKLNSDVDVCIQTLNVFFADYPEKKGHNDFGNLESQLNFFTFKSEVGSALKHHFGEADIREGKKAFDVLESGSRIEADAVPCFEHRRYTGNKDQSGSFIYYSGIEFITKNGGSVVSWPKQHRANGIHKNEATGTKFKKVVRIFRRLNYKMCDDGVPDIGNITGYLLECLCWNLDNSYFTSSSYITIVREILGKLYQDTENSETTNDWTEISGMKWLFRGSKPWAVSDVHNWTFVAWNYLGFK